MKFDEKLSVMIQMLSNLIEGETAYIYKMADLDKIFNKVYQDTSDQEKCQIMADAYQYADNDDILPFNREDKYWCFDFWLTPMSIPR